MYQPKVKNTQKYENSQGSHIVTSGKLVLMQERDSSKVPNSPLQAIRQTYNPIIISETEEIEVGDWIYNSRSGDILKEWTNIKVNPWWYKIIALPEHFSDKHLQAIVDGKMEDGDTVLVKCRMLPDAKDGRYTGFHYEIHLDQQNHITLFPAKQSLKEAAEEYASIISKDRDTEELRRHRKVSFEEGAQWAAKNNYKGGNYDDI